MDARPAPPLQVVRLDHLGFTVPDLAQAHAFLVNVLGCEYMYALGPFHDEHGDWMREHLGVEPRAVMRELRFYRLGGQAVLEVFEYEAEDQAETGPLNSDVGGHHLAVYVDDLDAAIQRLAEHGIPTMGEPTSSRGPSLGQRWVYFRAPWGMQLELVSYPGGKQFDRRPSIVE